MEIVVLSGASTANPITIRANTHMLRYATAKFWRLGGCADQRGKVLHDDSLSHAVLMPGFIESHANMMAGAMWQYAYVGDQHAALTIGEDHAQRMDGCRSALDAGVNIAIHSDAPVTPMGPLFTAWCAVNRRTMSGRVLGEAQCIEAEEALFAITMGAAYKLKLDNEIGSIETGKLADFAVLDEAPLSVDQMEIKDIKVLGTVFGGRVHLL